MEKGQKRQREEKVFTVKDFLVLAYILTLDGGDGDEGNKKFFRLDQRRVQKS